MNCQLCNSQDFIHKIDFGKQPVSHRFHNEDHPDNYSHPIEMGQCSNCGLVQILTPFPIKELIPKFSWLTCTEPEGHLDRLVDRLTNLPGITEESKILGLTFKEDTTLKRFNDKGYKYTYRFSLQDDYGVSDPLANVETAVDKFNYDFAKRFSLKYGKADIFICRHVIEHSINISHFIQAIKELTHEKSFVVVEIPECGSAFDLYDYTTVWEEHNLYFTGELLRHTFSNLGFSIHDYIQEPYPLEDACIVIAKKSTTQTAISYKSSNYENFVKNFHLIKMKTRERLLSFKEEGKIAIFGAGHMAVAFINLMEVHDLIDYVIDDNSNKINYLVPGTRISISPSEILYSKNITTCLSTLAPESDVKVKGKHSKFIQTGGRFLSVFAKNPDYFLKDKNEVS